MQGRRREREQGDSVRDPDGGLTGRAPEEADRLRSSLRARAAEGPTADEVGRLARLAGSALEDLRTTIDGLRRPLDGDLER
jgi:hypothetical protein